MQLSVLRQNLLQAKWQQLQQQLADSTATIQRLEAEVKQLNHHKTHPELAVRTPGTCLDQAVVLKAQALAQQSYIWSPPPCRQVGITPLSSSHDIVEKAVLFDSPHLQMLPRIGMWCSHSPVPYSSHMSVVKETTKLSHLKWETYVTFQEVPGGNFVCLNAS